MNKSNIALLSLLSLTLISCGGSGGGSSGGNNEVIRENQVATGEYRAFIRPLNTHTFGRINSGTMDVTVAEDMKVSLYMDDAPAITHTQAIFTGLRCPELSDDTNGDSYIDLPEATKAVGKILIPLDADLTSQSASAGFYPSGMAYIYNETAPLSQVMVDLQAADADVSDHMVKLRAGEELNLEGRVVVILGAPSTANLPGTVKTVSGMTSYQSIPISCGVIERVSE